MSLHRNLFLAAGLLVLGPQAAAAATTTLDSQLAACRAISDSARRLDCYDHIQEPPGGAPAAAAAPTATASLPPPPLLAAPAVPLAAPAAPATVATAPATVATAPATVATAPAPAQAAPVSTAVQAAPQGFGAETIAPPVPAAAQKDLKAHLKGSVIGLKRGMLFELDNGQTWQSIDDREYDCEGDDPALTISRNFAGNYWMQLEHCPYHLRVARVQ